jgi:hypothetical protein
MEDLLLEEIVEVLEVLARGCNPVGRGMPEQFGRGRGDVPPSGRGYGSTPHIAWRHNAIAVINDAHVPGFAHTGGKDVPSSKESLCKEDEELKDTGSSPIKNNLMDVDNPNISSDSGAKRSLELTTEDEMNNDIPEDLDVEHNDVVVGMTNQEVVHDNGIAKADRNKQSKKDGVVSPSLGSAGSLEGPVRSQ